MRKYRDKIWIAILIFLLICLAVLITGIVVILRPEEGKKTVVGAVFLDNVEDGGWSECHYKGIREACDTYATRLEIEENVGEDTESAEAAIERLIDRGCNVIFLTSDGYGRNLYPLMEKHNKIQFYTVSPDSNPKNCINYFGRLYQVRYLSGILAARMTKTNVLGFVGGKNTPQVNRGINAFALGARSVNPDVVVKVRFINTWTDPEAEKKAAKVLIKEDGADVIAYHTSVHTALDAAEEEGVYSIGYSLEKPKYSDNYLATVSFNWENLYENILEDFIKGDIARSGYYWHGVVFDTVYITDYSPLVSVDLRNEIEERKVTMDKNVEDVFFGDIYSNEGIKKCNKEERISDDALLRKMNWFVEGVEIYE